MIETGLARHVLVLGAETLTRVTDQTDRATCVLFGDGAAGALISAAEEDEATGFLGFELGADGSGGPDNSGDSQRSGGAESAMTGTSFAETVTTPTADTGKHTQYFEMFGHRGIWHRGSKAVTWHQAGTSFDDDRWELFDLDVDFNERHDLADEQPERLTEMVELWWREAEANQVLPLDDRFGERFAENAQRFHGARRRFVFSAGMGHLPSDVAPDLRSRSYSITAAIEPFAAGTEGVVIAHGDATCGYSLFVRDGHLVHDLNIGGTHQLVTSDERVPDGATVLAFRMRRTDTAEGDGSRAFPHGVGTLLVDGVEVGRMETDQIFWLMISWSGLDIGLDRGTTVADYDRTGRHVGPFSFTGSLVRVVVDLDNDQDVDHDAAGHVELARE